MSDPQNVRSWMRHAITKPIRVGDHWEWEENDELGPYILHAWEDDDGNFHREGRPAKIIYDKDGNKRSESWYHHGYTGTIDRAGAPAMISYYSNGNIRYEEWSLDDETLRIGGPAWIEYYEDGHTIEKVLWYSYDNEGWDTEPLYPKEVYQEMQNLLGRENLWNFIWKKCNLAILLSGFF